MISTALAPSSASRVANVCRSACTDAPRGTCPDTPASRYARDTRYCSAPRPSPTPSAPTNSGSERDGSRPPNRAAREARYSSITASSSGSTGTDRSLPPLPRTVKIRSPRRPPSEETVNSSSSVERSPAHSSTASTAKSRSGHGARRRVWSTGAAADSSSRSGVSSPRSGFGKRCGALGRPTEPIGLPGASSSATRNVKNWFHTDHARPTDEAARGSAYSANAARSVRPVTADTSSRCAPERPACRASTSATPLRSRR